MPMKNRQKKVEEFQSSFKKIGNCP
jgi:hypothetical protein